MHAHWQCLLVKQLPNEGERVQHKGDLIEWKQAFVNVLTKFFSNNSNFESILILTVNCGVTVM